MIKSIIFNNNNEFQGQSLQVIVYQYLLVRTTNRHENRHTLRPSFTSLVQGPS